MASSVDFGIFMPQSGLSWDNLLGRTLLAERCGYHSLWVADHLISPRLPGLAALECLAVVSALGAHTKQIRLGTLVLCNSFRNPALAAKSLSSIDHICGGRLEVGLGAGWLAEEYAAYGYEFPETAVRLRQLEESLQIIKAMFTKDFVTFRGRYYSVKEAPNEPKPLQKPHPPITVGGSGEKVMLRLVAKYADRWNCPAGYRDFKAKLDALHAHCRNVGRDARTLQVSEQLLVCIGRESADVEQKWKAAQRLKPFVFTGIKGTPAELIEQLRERIARGISMFTIIFSDFGSAETIELFAREVMPAFA